MDVSRAHCWVYGLVAIVFIGTTAWWACSRFLRGAPVTCPQCRRETRWLGNLPIPELEGYCLYCHHCGIMISVLETEMTPDERVSLQSTSDVHLISPQFRGTFIASRRM